MRISYITNSGDNSGVGYRALKIKEELRKSKSVLEIDEVKIEGRKGIMLRNGREIAAVKPWPGAFGMKSVNWIRLGRKIESAGSIVDLTNQSLSFLAKRLKPAVVTVHDLIELIEPQSKKAYWLNRYLHSGIKEADKIVAVSNFTAAQLGEMYEMDTREIKVIHNGVDQEQYYEIESFEDTVAGRQLISELRIKKDSAVMLYVGSEHPRKNIKGLLHVLMRARQKIGNITLIKIGGAGLLEGRREMLKVIDELNLKPFIRILENVSTERMNELYNVADVLVMPSKYEGFGMPVLEAFSAGTPVVCSTAASLPEVAERAAVLKDYDDIEGMADSAAKIIEDKEFRSNLILSGKSRALQFSWEKAAKEMLDVYQSLL